MKSLTGIDVMILKILPPKNGENIGAFFTNYG
jgi:hypothetical protein